MKKLEDVGVLVARILMPILFITAGWGKITGYAGTQQYMEAIGRPGFYAAAGDSCKVWWWSGNPVRFPDSHHSPVYCRLYAADGIFISQQLCRRRQSLMFMKNLTISGGFLLLAITGPGAYAGIKAPANKRSKSTLYLTIKNEEEAPRFCYWRREKWVN